MIGTDKEENTAAKSSSWSHKVKTAQLTYHTNIANIMENMLGNSNIQFGQNSTASFDTMQSSVQHKEEKKTRFPSRALANLAAESRLSI